MLILGLHQDALVARKLQFDKVPNPATLNCGLLENYSLMKKYKI